MFFTKKNYYNKTIKSSGDYLIVWFLCFFCEDGTSRKTLLIFIILETMGSQRARSPGRPGGEVGKGTRGYNYVSGI